MKFRDLLLKSIPYILSIIGGVTLFLITVDNVKDPSIADLMNNIAASLLSIPLVFLLYDYSNYRISSKLSQNLATNMYDQINTIMLNLVILMRHIIGVRGPITLESVNKMQNLTTSEIARRMKITNAHLDSLHKYHSDMDNLMYRSARDNILPPDKIQNLSGIVSDISRLANEYKFRSNKKIAGKYMADIISRISDWLDSDAGTAMHFQQMLQAAADSDVVPTKPATKK